MVASKSSTLTLRIEPTLKGDLRIAAATEQRSIATLMDVLIRDHCKQKNIAIHDGLALQADSKILKRVSQQSQTLQITP